MLLESYLSNLKNLPLNAEKIIVMRSTHHILSPSSKLLNDYQKGKIDWSQFEEKYIEEMNTLSKKMEMLRIKKLSEQKDVYLICHEKDGNCHRHILKKLIEKL